MIQDHASKSFRSHRSVRLCVCNKCQAGGRLRKEEVERLMSESMVNNYLRTQKDKIEAQVKQAIAVDEVFKQEGLKVREGMMKGAGQ